MHSQKFPMRRVAPCLGVLTARMTPTAQAGRKSWYESAPRGRRRKNAPTQRSATSPPEDTDADQARKDNDNQSGKLTSIWFGS